MACVVTDAVTVTDIVIANMVIAYNMSDDNALQLEQQRWRGRMALLCGLRATRTATGTLCLPQSH